MSLVDLPVELLDIVLSDVVDRRNATLKNICLAGNHKLSQVARRMTFRDIHIALKFPLPDRHPFYRRFKTVLDDNGLRNSVRSLSFHCRGHQDSIKLSQFMNKNLGRLSNVTHAYLTCSNEEACWLGCISRIILLPLIQMPALVHLEIRGCQCLCDDYFPVLSNMAELNHLTLEDVKLESRGSTDGWASVLRSMSGITTLTMKNCRWSQGSDSSGCLSAGVLLKELQAPDSYGWNRISHLHVGCSCEPCQWYCQADARQLVKLCECDLPNLEEIVVVSCTTDVFACTSTTLQELSEAFGRSLKRLWLGFIQCHCFTPNELASVAPNLRILEELGLQDPGTQTKAYASAFAEFPSLQHIHYIRPQRDPPRNLTHSRARTLTKHLAKFNSRLKSVSWISSDTTVDVERQECVKPLAVKRESSERDLAMDDEEEEEKDVPITKTLTSRRYRSPEWLNKDWLLFQPKHTD